jgi:hypothetical protein
MIGHIEIRERGPTPRGFAKQRRAMQKESWARLGVEYRRKYLPRRFTIHGSMELDYKRRTLRYQARKRRLLGHNNPLVFSGETRNLVLAGNDVRSTSSGVRIPLKGARKLNRNNPKSDIQMHMEIRRVSRREANSLARHFDGTLDSQLANDQTTTTTKVP